MNHVVTKERLEKVKRLRLFDDDYAKIVFKDKECVKCLLETLMQIDLEIVHNETERVLKVVGGRSIECDICVLSKEKAIDVELEKHNYRLHPKRVRYHVSALDTNVSKPSQEFDDMLDIVVIFVCEFDPVGNGKPLYHIRRYVDESKEVYKDENEIILVNGIYEGHDDIGKLIHDLKCMNPNDMYNEVLKEKTRYYKEHKEGLNIMCEAWEEERRAGELYRMITSLKSLIKNTNMTLEEAMNALELTEEEKQICREKLQ